MNCDKTAVALLTFAPPEAKAWLYDLDQPNPTGGIMLCRKHANATVVPMSWQLVDVRDPAWPGPAEAGERVEVSVAESIPHIPEIEKLITAALPSDTSAIDEEFAALHSDLPVTPQRYAEPQMATVRAAGGPTGADLVVGARETDVAPDPSLFELPLNDIPAVTPHSGY